MSQSALVQSSQSSPPQDIPDLLQTVTGGLTQDQSLQSFEHKKRIAEMEVETARLNKKKAKIELEKARLELEKIRSGCGKAASNLREDKENDDVEISSRINSVTDRFPCLPTEQIVKILNNKFKRSTCIGFIVTNAFTMRKRRNAYTSSTAYRR